MICRKCGADNKDTNSFCVECGAPMIHEKESSRAYKPLGVLAYLGYEILFMIPVVGLVSLLYLALGGTENKNLKNFAGFWLCKILIFIVIAAVLFLTGVISIDDLLLAIPVI